MSTPNTSLVKWVLEKDIFTSYAKVAEYQERDNIAAPVIPLADLTALVEGLRDAREIINDHAPGFTVWLEESEKILVQLEAHRKEG